MTDLIGTVINNKFKVLNLLGEGGMSFVFKAMDIQKNILVVIKFMKEKVTSNYIDDIIRFRREIEIVSKLDHENIMRINGAGEFEGKPYLGSMRANKELIRYSISTVPKFSELH